MGVCTLWAVGGECFRQSRFRVVVLMIPRSKERLALQRRSGFVMPLAMTASAVLLLGSASIHTLSLQGHWRHQASLRRLQALDQLQSAAQAFVADARAAEACLLLQSSDRWHQPGSDCVHADPDRLRQGWVNDQRWQLLAWRADHDRGQLDLSLADGRAARFYLQLDSASPSVVAVSQPQLLGRAQAGGAS
ncbi:MAG: hypothetical protein VX628_02170 [Cyanobacteriota bacterium]|nr:hypothetical protein [Cyanobacteriota bacterium]